MQYSGINLNVNVFSKNVKEALQKIKDIISSEEQAELVVRMHKRLNTLANRDFMQKNQLSEMNE